MSILFHQLYEDEGSTLTYLLADPLTGDAVLIDTVVEHVGHYIKLLRELDLELVWLLETHGHGDYASAAEVMRDHTGARIAASRGSGMHWADQQLEDGDTIVFGNEVLRVIATPGHTPACISLRWRDRVFTGDSLMIGGCGRTDFPGGDAGTLYDSITQRLFALPGETLVYPAHDYRGMRVSSIEQERTGNARLAKRSRQEFITMMTSLRLPEPRLPDQAGERRRARFDELLDVHAA